MMYKATGAAVACALARDLSHKSDDFSPISAEFTPPGWLLVSRHFYNTQEEARKLLAALRE